MYEVFVEEEVDIVLVVDGRLILSSGTVLARDAIGRSYSLGQGCDRHRRNGAYKDPPVWVSVLPHCCIHSIQKFLVLSLEIIRVPEGPPFAFFVCQKVRTLVRVVGSLPNLEPDHCAKSIICAQPKNEILHTFVRIGGVLFQPPKLTVISVPGIEGGV